MRALYTDARAAMCPYPDSERPTRVIIDLDALAHNFREVLTHAQGKKILAVVKAEAYGHGAVEVSRRLLSVGADMLAVALVEEGRKLREAGIAAPIVVMGAVFPQQAEALVGLGLTPVIVDLGVAGSVSAAAKKRGVVVSAHVKIDTGMGRIGIAPEDAPAFLAELKKLPNISVDGLMTHFADVESSDKKFALHQMERFESLLKKLELSGTIIPVRHAANSAAVLDYPGALFTMVRPGLMLYGYNPLEASRNTVHLRPVLSLLTRISFIKKVPAGVSISYGRTFTTQRESVIATLPIGYADGFNRGLSNRGSAIVRGKRVPVVGRVTMDMCMLDVTDVRDVQQGDDVVLIGEQGNERITADDIAAQLGTIPYEVLCAISDRVPRIYQ